MKTAVVLALLGLLALPALALAQIHLTWGNCAILDFGAGEPPATPNQDFDCTSPSEYTLHATFKTDRDVPGFFGMDIRIDLVWSDWLLFRREEPLHPFWHFEASGCNASGIQFSVDKSVSGGCGALATPWGEHGEGATVDVLGYGPDFALGRGVFLANVRRALDDPFPIQADTDYYAFHLVFNTDNAGACPGCMDRIVVYWSGVLFTYEDGAVQNVLLPWPVCEDCGSEDYATINGRNRPVPTEPTTWGQIKSQYR